MPNHQDTFLAFRQVGELLRFGTVQCEGLFYIDVLAGRERLSCHSVMMFSWGGNDHGVNRRVFQNSVVGSYHPNVWISIGQPGQPFWAEVAHPLQRSEFVEYAN